MPSNDLYVWVCPYGCSNSTPKKAYQDLPTKPSSRYKARNNARKHLKTAHGDYMSEPILIKADEYSPTVRKLALQKVAVTA